MLIDSHEAGRKPALGRRGYAGVAFAAAMALPTAAHAVDQPIRGYIASSVTAGATAIYALEDSNGASGFGAQPRGVSGSSETPIGNYPHQGAANGAANVTTAHNGSVGASAQATGYGGGSGASSHLVYDIRVIGEDRPEGVPYTISAFGYADSTGQFDQDYGFGHARRRSRSAACRSRAAASR
ncbi:hypothetical protein [Sphingomonas quercus]|uniref:Uncharacterized protein n=1 Tax=Sphingomonas quercus TaxID=2842451 RepID=A0ABS6BH28_9SPHN|nr:hypothetical protein [Sphingomonas quercus]MBU3077609.1 hypothetical protein [Sphingomonas quercus]